MGSLLMAALREAGETEPTLDDYLNASDCDNTFDAELLEVIPAEFRAEHEDRLRLNSHYQRKFAEQTSMKRASLPRPDRSLCAMKIMGLSRLGTAALPGCSLRGI